MSGFGQWQAHAEIEGYGRDIVLSIGRETARNQFETVTMLGVSGATLHTEDKQENASLPGRVRVPVEMAEVLYTALHRLYGHQNQDGKVEALNEALAVERNRVNAFLQVVLQPQAHVSAAPPTPK